MDTLRKNRILCSNFGQVILHSRNINFLPHCEMHKILSFASNYLGVKRDFLCGLFEQLLQTNSKTFLLCYYNSTTRIFVAISNAEKNLKLRMKFLSDKTSLLYDIANFSGTDIN